MGLQAADKSSADESHNLEAVGFQARCAPMLHVWPLVSVIVCQTVTQQDEAVAGIPSDVRSSRKLALGRLHEAMRVAAVASAASEVSVRQHVGPSFPLVCIE